MTLNGSPLCSDVTPVTPQPFAKALTMPEASLMRRKIVEIADGEHVRAVEIGGRVRTSWIERIVAVEEKPGAKTASFIQGVRIGVRSVDLQPMAHFLREAELQSVVVRDALRRPQVGVRVDADELRRNAVFPSEKENSPICVCTSSAGSSKQVGLEGSLNCRNWHHSPPGYP